MVIENRVVRRPSFATVHDDELFFRFCFFVQLFSLRLVFRNLCHFMFLDFVVFGSVSSVLGKRSAGKKVSKTTCLESYGTDELSH